MTNFKGLTTFVVEDYFYFRFSELTHFYLEFYYIFELFVQIAFFFRLDPMFIISGNIWLHTEERD